MKTSKQRVNLFLNPEIVERAKKTAVLNDIPLSKLVEITLNNYLDDVKEMRVEFVPIKQQEQHKSLL